MEFYRKCIGSERPPEFRKSGFGGQSSKMNEFRKELNKQKKIRGDGQNFENLGLKARAPK